MDNEISDHYQNVFNLCYKILKNYEDAEDAAQNTFLKFHRKRSQWREDCALSSWLFRIAVNESLMMLRVNKRRDSRLTYETAEIVKPEDNTPSDKQIISMFEYLVDKYLDKRDKPLVHLLLQEFEHHEIGEAMGLTVPAVKSRVHRARTIFRESKIRDIDNFRKAVNCG
jgi:RNA polymerase sigma-70 factor (ECF subfamily)